MNKAVATAPEQEEVDERADEFESFAEEFADDEEVESGELEASEAEEQPSEEPVQAAEEEEAPEEAQEAEAPEPPEEPPAEAAEAEEAPKAQGTKPEEPKEPEQPEVDLEELKSQALEEIQSRYELSEEEAESLSVEPNKVLPKLAARLYMDVFENITNGIMATLPQMITAVMESQKAAQEAERAFFSKWDKLDPNNPEHVEAVRRIGATYRAMNPDADQERFIAEVGAQVLMSLGIPFEEIVDKPEPPAPVPHQPAKPAAAPSPPPRPRNAFEELAEEFLDDE